jgi:2-dehydro-3-deoxygluconokinase
MARSSPARKEEKRIVGFGELLARFNCPTGKRLLNANTMEFSFGGAEANVCVLLSRLGVPAQFVSRLPSNDWGQAALDSLRANGVDGSQILFGEDKMGLYFTEYGSQLRPSRVSYDRQHSSFANLLPGMLDWDQILDGACWFHWSGISPALSKSMAAVCQEALESARQKGIRISADLNYRSTLWNYGEHPSQVMPPLLAYCDVLTGDLDAAHLYLGIRTDEGLSLDERFMTCARAMQDRLPLLRVLAMSFRGTTQAMQPTYCGALFDGQQGYFTTPIILPLVIDRIGSGDAFTAGLIYALYHQFGAQQAISFAWACGALKHGLQGDYALISKQEIEHFIQAGPSGRIIR